MGSTASVFFALLFAKTDIVLSDNLMKMPWDSL